MSHNPSSDMSSSMNVFLYLLCLGIGRRPSVHLEKNLNIDWIKLVELAEKHGVGGILLDGIYDSNCRNDIQQSFENSANESAKYKLFGHVLLLEKRYSHYEKSIIHFLHFLRNHGIRSLILKGYGISRIYPHPQHRSCGDIDVFLYGNGKYLDELVEKELNIVTKKDEDKHSSFKFHGVTVENHASIINDLYNTKVRSLSSFLIEDARNAIDIKIGDQVAFVPSLISNLLYLPYHFAVHFARGEARLYHLCDWAVFLSSIYEESASNQGAIVDWNLVKGMALSCGFFPFLCCINGLVVDYLGVDDSCVPPWPRDRKNELRILADILYCKYDSSSSVSLTYKVRRLLGQKWKYKLIIGHNTTRTFFSFIVSYLLALLCGKTHNVWES